MPHVTAIDAQTRVPHAVLSRLRFVRPVFRAFRRLAQPRHVLFQAFVLLAFEILFPFEIFRKRGKISALYPHFRLIQRQDMIDRAVEKFPVVGNEYEPFLAMQIPRHDRTGGGVEVVGRLVDKQKFPVV